MKGSVFGGVPKISKRVSDIIGLLRYRSSNSLLNFRLPHGQPVGIPGGAYIGVYCFLNKTCCVV
jgi:hypothetical protein